MHVLELLASTVTFMADDIVHTHFKDDHLVSMEDVQAMFDAIAAERKGRKALLMVSVGLNTTMSNEARAFAAQSPESSRHIAADAIIVRDFGHQLAANVFVRHHKPGRPIQMFGDQQSALDWLRSQHHLLEN
ncbi:MAG: hypothetical protein IPJ85_15715 [Flavobacteriales bacterium]|nr:hypothetical protein [Flavobacteriales bacterium]